MIALQLLVSLAFLLMGVSGLAKKIIDWIPNSVKAGVLLGAGFAAILGEFKVSGRFDQFPLTLTVGGLFTFYLLFSKSFVGLRGKYPLINSIGRYGMLPAIILAIIIGPIIGEVPVPQVDFSGFIFIPDFAGIISRVSPFSIGFPTLGMFLAALPMVLSVYIIAFGDFVTAQALITEADEVRKDEVIEFNSNRSNLISGIRNLIESFISPYTQLCGPLWAAVTASVAQRYQEGREGMDSIYSGAGTFRLTTFIAVATIPIVTLVQPILPIALSLTLLVQGFVCARVGMKMVSSNEEMGVAGVMAAVLATKGAAWGLAVGFLLFLLIQYRGSTPAEANKSIEA